MKNEFTAENAILVRALLDDYVSMLREEVRKCESKKSDNYLQVANAYNGLIEKAKKSEDQMQAIFARNGKSISTYNL